MLAGASWHGRALRVDLLHFLGLPQRSDLWFDRLAAASAPRPQRVSHFVISRANSLTQRYSARNDMSQHMRARNLRILAWPSNKARMRALLLGLLRPLRCDRRLQALVSDRSMLQLL
jgi:hypothetical protein